MYTILINSSDGYEDCWFPFFTFFKKYWNNYQNPILLNTEFKEFNFPGLNIKSSHVNFRVDRKLTWSECLIEALNEIETPLILYFQEDYFIEKTVKVELIDEFAKKMIEDISIKFIGLTYFTSSIPLKQLPDDNRLCELSKKSKYLISTQCALWNKETLLSYLRPEENGWMFEIFGTRRARKREDIFLNINKQLYNDQNPIIYYQNTGIIKGKWLNTIPALFAKESLKMDFTKRGIYKEKKPFLRKFATFKKIIKTPVLMYKGLRGF